jgi:AcrR family transcriptional regulator
MSTERKKMFVETAYKILQEEGLENIKARRLAQELKCTPTVIYRYFDNIDHLIALASIRILNEYLVDFRNLVNDPQILTDPYGLNLRMWDCLGKHAFQNIPIYENLFFRKYKNSLGDIIFEYYQLFLADVKQDFDGYSTSILFNDDIFQRDLILLRRASAVGTITFQEAEYLSQIECHIFHGVLLKYMDNYNEPGIPEKATAEFSELIHELARKYC